LVTGFTAPTEMSILNRFRLKTRLHNAPVISVVLWRAHSVHWMKVNTDGSVTTLPPSAACGHLVTFRAVLRRSWTLYQFYMQRLWPSS
jgi:hypothetical protein